MSLLLVRSLSHYGLRCVVVTMLLLRLPERLGLFYSTRRHAIEDFPTL